MSSKENWLDKISSNLWEIIFLMWAVGSLAECSFTASTEQGVSVGVQSRQEEKKTESVKAPVKNEDGPVPDWK